MFKLKRVELVGFKSFADRTRLEFGSGTAAVVGPNGCGKSNLGDAINWVLGEQSPRSLRGDRMADVIFNGTRLRAATSMAEVSLTLIDPKALEAKAHAKPRLGHEPQSSNGAVPIHSAATLSGANGANGNGAHDYASRAAAKAGGEESRLTFPDGEIVVSRRLFRSGESEYLINGQACRLRDIQELFMGTGLGPDSYAIIEQGRIGQILSSKPSDRRAIIEEAAGVSKFRTRKRLAEAKLESARQNLARVTDILEEVSKQAGSLKRQASKARRYRELNDDLGLRLRSVLSSRLLLLGDQCEAARQQLGILQAGCSGIAQELEALEVREKSAASRHDALETELARLREATAAADLEREKLLSRLDQAQQQISNLDARRNEAGEERNRLAAQIDELAAVAEERARRADEVRAEAESAASEVQDVAARQAELTAALREAERRLEAARNGIIEAVARVSDLRNRLAQADENAAALARKIARTESERESGAEECRKLEAELESCRVEQSNVEQALSSAAHSAEAAAALLNAARTEEVRSRTRVDELREELSKTKARRDALGESLARHAYSTESVRRLLAGVPGDSPLKPLGVLADFVEVSPGYEEVMEEFLRDELECVVVENYAQARQCLRLLQSEAGGRSTFLINGAHAAVADGAASPEVTGSRREAISGTIACLADLVRFDPRLGLEGSLVLPALDRAFVVDDDATAERLAAEHPNDHFLTRNGEHYRFRMLSGGKGPSAGPLALRRDYRELDRKVNQLEPVLEEARSAMQQALSRRNQLEEEVRQIGAARVESEKNSLRVGERTRQAEQALVRSRKQLEVLETELLAARREAESLVERRGAIEMALQTANVAHTTCEAEIGQAGETARQLRGEADRVANELGQARARLGALGERQQAAQAARVAIELQLNETRSRMTRLDAQVETWDREKTALVAEGARLDGRIAEVERERSEARSQASILADEAQQARRDRDELGPAVAAVRERLENERERRTACEVALARAESDFNHHSGLCREELGREPADLMAETPRESALAPEALEAAEAEVRDIRKRIGALGPINMMALEELKEAEERLTFLETQRQDMLSSIADTSQAIREIDEVSRRQFMEAFVAINSNFAETFRTLFGGGIGAMRLSDENDPDSGIDLVAQPPGKRLQSVLLLSGGEKALVALALLIAIFRYVPSPFCVLDEVDAPLDDSNVERFTRMIRAMSQHTQFILMTHNKRTMEICPMMYGVTMEEPGVSKLVSVRFEAPEREPVLVAS